MPIPSAYLHVPFCRHRCGYCNFTVVAGRDDLADKFLLAIERELQTLGEPREVETIFLGGGTPTHLSLAQLEKLLQLVNHWLPLAANGEFSVEANPSDTLSPWERTGVRVYNSEKLELLRQHGVTRLSLGAQSFHSRKLALLERDHDAAVIRAAVGNARQLGFDVSLDLIFATPNETLTAWHDDLQQAIGLAPDHISTYGLTLERGTAFYNRHLHGELHPADEELERDMYLAAIDTLTAAGFEHYEVSNFARPGQRCRHNENYWLGGEYFAFGPGAARHIAGRRSMNHRSTTTWLARMLAGESPVAESEQLSPEDRARERLVFGLRRLEGIAADPFQQDTGFELFSLIGERGRGFIEQGLLAWDGETLRLTRAGLLVSDAIWPYFLVGDEATVESRRSHVPSTEYSVPESG